MNVNGRGELVTNRRICVMLLLYNQIILALGPSREGFRDNDCVNFIQANDRQKELECKSVSSPSK